MIGAGTGHRMPSLGGYSDECFAKVVAYARFILPSYKLSKAISGMAGGWDQAIALAALDLGISLIAAIPFLGQESLWPASAQKQYHDILKRASEVVIVCEGGYAPSKFIKRDRWMVDRSHVVLALWNGHESGGTFKTVKYAESIQKPVYNVWPGWTCFEVQSEREGK